MGAGEDDGWFPIDTKINFSYTKVFCSLHYYQLSGLYNIIEMKLGRLSDDKRSTSDNMDRIMTTKLCQFRRD